MCGPPTRDSHDVLMARKVRGCNRTTLHSIFDLVPSNKEASESIQKKLHWNLCLTESCSPRVK